MGGIVDDGMFDISLDEEEEVPTASITTECESMDEQELMRTIESNNLLIETLQRELNMKDGRCRQ